ncbi:MAG: Tol-Pal system beta propeller repeat protein TolB [Syntrophaceae bacterium]|nr:Tol-Pal system beta propeller repeat protein TolB [Syntrophaceae bacterium]
MAKVYLDIDSPAFQKFPIAVTDFQSRTSGPGSEGLSQGLADRLGHYLDVTGFFNVISRKAFLEDPRKAGILPGTFRFDDWSAIGSEFLVKGSFAVTGTELDIEARLFDVVKGEVLVAKGYKGRKDKPEELLRRFASDILMALTGEGGVFDTKIAFVMKSKGKGDIYSVLFDGTERQRLTSHQSILYAPRWSPDGRMLAFTSYKDGTPDLYVQDLATRRIRKLIDYGGINLAGSWSPDGRRLLVTLSKDGNEEIYVLDTSSYQLRRLTFSASIDISPAWSPDGTRIAFVSNRGGSPQIYLMNTDGSNVRRLTFEGNYNTSPSWSPRGKRLAFEGMAGGRFQIFTIDEDGSNLLQLTFDRDDNESPTWSPDGRYIVYSSRRGGGRIQVMNVNGTNVRTLQDGGATSPSWSPRLK